MTRRAGQTERFWGVFSLRNDSTRAAGRRGSFFRWQKCQAGASRRAGRRCIGHL